MLGLIVAKLIVATVITGFSTDNCLGLIKIIFGHATYHTSVCSFAFGLSPVGFKCKLNSLDSVNRFHKMCTAGSYSKEPLINRFFFFSFALWMIMPMLSLVFNSWCKVASYHWTFLSQEMYKVQVAKTFSTFNCYHLYTQISQPWW